MAKGNLFQGMARGSVGDVVFTRINGKQISKQRNRQPHNPRTSKQKYQRAIMATVLQAYKAGQEIFNHAWQGVPVGGDVQALFMKRNARLLRTAISQTVHNYAPRGQELNTSARVVYPRATVPVPNRYQISQGSYNVECFEEVGSAGEWRLKTPAGAEMPTSWEDYYKKIGLVEGDIYTFCWFQQGTTLAYRTETETGSIDPRRSVWNCNFVYARFRVLPPPTDAFDYSQQLTKVMEYTGGTARIGSYEYYLNLRSALVIGNYIGKYSWGLIRSREDSPLRSTSYMGSPIINTAYGIAPTVINEVWTHSGQPLGASELILEGGEDYVPPPPVLAARQPGKTLLLRDGTETTRIPTDYSLIRGVWSYDRKHWVIRASEEDRIAGGGNPNYNVEIDPNINCPIDRKAYSDIPRNAKVSNMYYLRYAMQAIVEFAASAGDVLTEWCTNNGHFPTTAGVSGQLNLAEHYYLGVQTNLDNIRIAHQGGPTNYAYVWLLDG